MSFIIFGAVALVVLVMLLIKVALNTDREIEASEQALRKFPGFSPTRDFLGADAKTGIAVDENTNTICLFSIEPLIYRLVTSDQLLSAEIFENGLSIMRTSRTSQVTDALVGSPAFGGIGAVIGGLSGETVTSGPVSRIELRLTVDDARRPLHDVVFMSVEGEKNGGSYNAAMREAREWLGVMHVLIKRGETSKQATALSSSSQSVE